jgi:hypothetical protein
VAKKRIFTVGFSLPGDEFEYIEFESNQTLLDADIILFEPTFGSASDEPSYASGALHAGVPVLTENSSFVVKRQVDHWHSEIVAAVNAGKLVIVYLAEPIDRYRHTGEKTYSGSGKSRITTRAVVEISTYDSVPKLRKVTAKVGASIRLEKEVSYLASYWKEFAEYSPYEVEIEGDFNRVLLKSPSGERVVGAAFHGESGVLLFLPPIRYDDEEFEREAEEGEDEYETYWTDDALKFGKRIVSSLITLNDTFKSSSRVTPPPTWSLESKYRVASEKVLEAAILKCATDAASLMAKKEQLESELVNAGALRRLLFEQGKPLEKAVIEAMRSLGFDGQSFTDGESEFDGIFVSQEGRCLGEVEGKDNKAISIEKFSQLERNLQEDFARDEVTEHAKGILFGNAFRLLPVGDRTDFFTAKCLSAAKRIGAALVRTPDLFAPAKYLKENPANTEYARKCREAIVLAAGEIVAFPPPPENEAAKHFEPDGAQAAVPANS